MTSSRRLSSPGVGVAVTALLVAVAALAAASPSVEVDPRLEALRPLLGKTWQGTLASPDGARSFLQVVTFEPMAGGKVVKITRTNRDLGTRAEGFIYLDDVSKQVRLFLVESSGVFSEGTVTSERNTITFEGTMTWPRPPPNPGVKQRYEFRNTFEVHSDTSMRDSWHQNAFGPWRPGHVIDFEAVPGGEAVAQAAPIEIGFANPPASGTDRDRTLRSVVKVRDISEAYATGGLYLITHVGDREALFEKENAELLRHRWIEQPWRFCTIFSSANAGSPLIGRNWDNQNVGSVIVSRYRPAGGYASVSFTRAIDLGFPMNVRIDEMAASPLGDRLLLAPFYAYDGINEKGLFAAVAGVGQVEVRAGEGAKRVFIAYLVRMLLDRCRTLEEALRLVEGVVPFDLDEKSLNCHFFVADATGRSVVLEFTQGSWKKVPGDKGWQVLTNKAVFGTPDATLREKCPRYRTASEKLEARRGTLDWPSAMQLLRDTSQPGTTWSVVYMPASAKIHLSVYQDWDRIYRLDFPARSGEGSPPAARGSAQAPAGNGASKDARPTSSGASKSGQEHAPSAVLLDQFFKAVQEGNSERVLEFAGTHPELLDARNAAGATALLSAVQSDHAPVARLLLDLGADPSARDRFGFAPLHRAAENDRLETVEMLLARKAAVDPVVLEGYYGYTPLTFAIMKGNLEMVRRLHEAGADIHHRTKLRENYLHFASAFNRTEIAEYLMARGIGVNAPKAGGLTPLHIAAITGRLEMAELLIRKGADLNPLSTDLGTPLHFAEAAMNSDIADLLRRSGAADRPRAFPEYRGRYLGQTPPGNVPRPFAPELFRDVYRAYGPPVFSPDGREMFFYGYFMPWIGYSRIWWTREENGRWTAPVLAPFSDHPSWGPAFSPDGRRLYFASRRSKGGTSAESTDLWFAEKQDGTWSRAQCLGSPPNRDDHNEMLPTIAADGSLYFMAFGPAARGTRMFTSRLTDGRFTDPIPLDDLIDQGLADEGRGVAELILYRYSGDRYAEISILFRHPDGRWTRPVSLGDLVHKGHGTNAGLISPDRRYLFFCQDITPYWVDASFIQGLREGTLTGGT